LALINRGVDVADQIVVRASKFCKVRIAAVGIKTK